MKRLFDFICASLALIIFSPLIGICLYLIYRQDKQWPLYSPYRAGLHNKPFRMHKMRSMVAGADKTKMDTTSANDMRITKLGHAIRRYKLDELPQLWNIVRGEMSFVGPRPQIDREVALYTDVEKNLLDVRPGITDFSSIVFSDLGDIMANEPDPNIAYNQLVRPWKSRMGLFYIRHASVALDLCLIVLTVVTIVSRRKALKGIVALMSRLHADPAMIRVASRTEGLVATPPPGSDTVVTTR